MTTGRTDRSEPFRRELRALLGAALAAAILAGPAGGAVAETFITVASTTSTENSGLLRDILPKFRAKSGIEVRVVAVGTGAALRLGQNGDADVVLVHAREAEDAFVAAGHGIDRRDVMYNDYVIVGPKADPAGISGMKEAGRALARIAEAAAPFASRADDSGTHKAELALWQAAGVDPKPGSGKWYFETGSGMGATLNTAAGRDAYALTDRATWLAHRNRGTLAVLVEGDERLFNPYGVIQVNPARHPHVKEEAARAFIGWLTGPDGQAAIAGFRSGGEQLFFPSVRR
jgi:tungstate transport system substrate-binding protein